ncbi:MULTISPECIES: mycothiol synthase [unclassified Actinotalea]|uniref:mycothiol synthase n=1 Tax=unclassified Actinotalea TaxID=2638618 RepID=UPI0015F3FB40|nr:MULTISPECIES: mycothiol synthase [unclassified Actinotalea]
MSADHHLRTVPPHTQLDAGDAAAVRALAAAAQAHDGIEALGEQTLLDLAGPSPARHVLAVSGHASGDPAGDTSGEAAGEAPTVVGYAAVRHDGPGGGATSAELVVHPDHRGRGLGTALLAAVRDGSPAGTPPVWAHGNLPAARALAARAGLAVVRELWQMARDLPADEGALPSDAMVAPGVTVRPFVVGRDEDAWLRVNARAFARHPEQGRMTRADLDAREAEPWFDPADLLLAERDGVVVASVWMKVEPGSDEGELYVLGVDPDAQGRGLGRLLTARTLAHLGARGLRRVVLYVSAGDEAAVRTYRRAGFETVRADVQYADAP